MGYEYEPSFLRAQCLRVIDGDTVDLLVDCGFHNHKVERFRLYGIDTYELNSKDAAERTKALEAKVKLTGWLGPSLGTLSTLEKVIWPLKIRTQKDPDNFGRWLAEVWFVTDGKEIEVGSELIALGLAVPYRR